MPFPAVLDPVLWKSFWGPKITQNIVILVKVLRKLKRLCDKVNCDVLHKRKRLQIFAARAQRISQCARLNFTMLSERIKILHLLLSVRNLIHFACRKFMTQLQSVDFKNYVFLKQLSQNA